MDWRCNAARAASSSRTSWGTPLMVICTDMNALCHRRQRSASSSPYNRESDAGGLKAIYEGSSTSPLYLGLRRVTKDSGATSNWSSKKTAIQSRMIRH